MRLAVFTLALTSLTIAGAARAQFVPIQPIQPPTNPYALPSAPRSQAAPPAFQPFQPPTFVPPSAETLRRDPYALSTEAPPVPGRAFHPKAPEPFKPYIGESTYADGPFSPAAEARRERKAAKPPVGTFSPEADARRARERQRESEKNAQPF